MTTSNSIRVKAPDRRRDGVSEGIPTRDRSKHDTTRRADTAQTADPLTELHEVSSIPFRRIPPPPTSTSRGVGKFPISSLQIERNGNQLYFHDPTRPISPLAPLEKWIAPSRHILTVRVKYKQYISAFSDSVQVAIANSERLPEQNEVTRQPR